VINSILIILGGFALLNEGLRGVCRPKKNKCTSVKYGLTTYWGTGELVSGTTNLARAILIESAKSNGEDEGVYRDDWTYTLAKASSLATVGPFFIQTVYAFVGESLVPLLKNSRKYLEVQKLRPTSQPARVIQKELLYHLRQGIVNGVLSSIKSGVYSVSIGVAVLTLLGLLEVTPGTAIYLGTGILAKSISLEETKRLAVLRKKLTSALLAREISKVQKLASQFHLDLTKSSDKLESDDTILLEDLRQLRSDEVGLESGGLRNQDKIHRNIDVLFEKIMREGQLAENPEESRNADEVWALVRRFLRTTNDAQPDPDFYLRFSNLVLALYKK